MQADQPPSPPPSIIVARAADSEPMVLLGFAAFGGADDLARLEAAAGAAQLRSGRRVHEDGTIELAIAFLPGTAREPALRLYHDARDGRYGALRIEAILVSVAAGQDGVDLDEIRLAPPASIREE